MEEGVQMKGIRIEGNPPIAYEIDYSDPYFNLVRLPKSQVSSGNITLSGGVEIKGKHIKGIAGKLLPWDEFLPNATIYEIDPGIYVYAPTIIGATPGEKIPSYLASGQLFYFLPVAIKGDNYIGYYANKIHWVG